MSQICSM